MAIGAHDRSIAISVDLSEESAYALNWAVKNYLRKTDTVVVLHVQPTSGLYGADWGPSYPGRKSSVEDDEREFDALTLSKAEELCKPLRDAGINYRIHIVKDHDMKERICLEMERLGCHAVVMGSKGFGATRRSSRHTARMGSVSDYCVHHCGVPIVVVRMPEAESGETDQKGSVGRGQKEGSYSSIREEPGEAGQVRS